MRPYIGALHPAARRVSLRHFAPSQQRAWVTFILTNHTTPPPLSATFMKRRANQQPRGRSHVGILRVVARNSVWGWGERTSIPTHPTVWTFSHSGVRGESRTRHRDRSLGFSFWLRTEREMIWSHLNLTLFIWWDSLCRYLSRTGTFHKGSSGNAEWPCGTVNARVDHLIHHRPPHSARLRTHRSAGESS